MSSARAADGAWLRALRRYYAVAVPADLLWEFLHLPLYTIWHEEGPGEIVFAALHCTGGDVLIATATLVLALLLAGSGWPLQRTAVRQVAALTVALGVGYTVFSEWLNTEVREAWAYADAMPVLPLLETGLTPVLQWLVIPSLSLWWAGRPFQSARGARRYA